MKSVLIHGILAVFGLGFAYQTWTREPDVEEAPGAVTVVECKESDLQKLSVETETNRVTVEPQKQKDETVYWVTVQRKPKPVPPPDPKAQLDGGAAKTPEPPKEDPETLKPKVFLANAAFKDYLKLVTPLKAQQGLGALPKDKLADFGFDKVETTFKLSCAGKSLDFEAGARTFGSSGRYVRDAKSKTAYLFNDDVVSDLQSAQFKFMQTDLHAFVPADVEDATVEVRGTKKKLLQRDRKSTDKATWVDASAPAKRNELYGNWFTRVTRLRAREYLPRASEPGSDLKTTGGEMTPVLTIDYKVEGKPNGKLELVKVEENGTPHYYARSEATRSWVTVFDSAAKEVEQDAPMVVGLEETPPEKAAPPPKSAGGAPPHGGNPHGGLGGLPSGHPVVPPAGNPHAAPPAGNPSAPQKR
ncbi:MAG TPA: DUF4340 domain-containing protein [Polyangiales bacterium]|nr:DUF4340 domain-containing protein [Polyangiales bacterium]